MAVTQQFSILDVFVSETRFSGNPAAVISHAASFQEEDVGKIAAQLNQPALAVIGAEIAPSSPTHEEKTFGIRWFTPHGYEIALCGHGTFAAAQHVFTTNPDLRSIRFISGKGAKLHATKLQDGRIDIEFPEGLVQKVPPELDEKITRVLKKACNNDDLKIDHIATGAEGTTFSSYILVELDEKEDLEHIKVDVSVLVCPS